MGFLNGILDIIFPPKCVFCSGFLKKDEHDVCEKCRPALPRTSDPVIMAAGHHFDVCVSPFYYTGVVRKALMKYKFGNSPERADYYGKLLASCIAENLSGRYDLISWVPLSDAHKNKRGYDQAMLLALATALELNDVAVETLWKNRDTDTQSRINDINIRRENVKNAYSIVDEDIISGKRILLIDDIITTGATLDECARTLYRGGAKAVVCACFARSEKM